MEKKKLPVKVMHITDVMRELDVARIRNQRVNVTAWSEDGRVIEYQGWAVQGGHWKGGFHRLRHPVSKEIRTVPDCFIIKFMGKQVIY